MRTTVPHRSAIDMQTNRLLGPTLRTMILAGLSVTVIPAALLCAQDSARPDPTKPSATLTLSEARALARRASAELTAAREAAAAAAARERQAGAFPNPTLSYQREQASANGQTNSQNIASVDQPIELRGTRSARISVARLRREAAQARIAAAEAQLDFEVTRAYAVAVSADRRAALAEQAATAFARARTVSGARLAGGDVSGYAHRRVRLEAARYAALFAEAALTRRIARVTLASLLAPSGDALRGTTVILEDSVPAVAAVMPDDSLQSLAVLHRADLRVAAMEAKAAASEARLATRERVPVPTLSAGIKNEQAIGGEAVNGFVAGVSLPLALWDRRRGAIEAASAESRRRVAETEVVRRRVAHEVAEAADALRAVDDELAILRPHLGAESEAALRAAQVAYSEGEISLVEWLDAVRAYHEAETTYVSLRAESLIRRAALERAVGVSLSRDSR